MTNAEIIEMLNEDLRGEHMAIVQYLRHAYAMGEGEMACEIEAISREEMRHFDWLSELIVELGGKPTLERDDFTGFSDIVAENMRFDVQAEDDAIALYRKHLEAIEDPDIRRLLSRILSDEESHRGDFLHFIEKAERESKENLEVVEPEGGAVPGPAGPEGPSLKRVQEILKYGITHEYTVVLQYLYHVYQLDCEVGEELEDQAINEMQHLGWLSEELEGIGGRAEMEHTDLALEGSPAEMLQSDIAVERLVTAAYSRQIPELEDEGLKELLTRIRDHEIYHIEVFSDLLQEVQREDTEAEKKEQPSEGAPQAPKKPPAVGSLYGKAQDEE